MEFENNKFKVSKVVLPNGLEVVNEQIRKEIDTLSSLLSVLSNGIAKPMDITYQIKKLYELQEKGNMDVDLTEVINCCPQDGTIREAREFRPLLQKVLDRLNLIFDTI